jgi:hypothetical protein
MTSPIAMAWESLLLKVQVIFSVFYPTAAKIERYIFRTIFWDMLLIHGRSMVSTYAHEGAKKYSFITLIQTEFGTVGEFLELFKAQKWISGAAYEKRQIEL